MRISAEPTDPAFVPPNLTAGAVRVYLDGIERTGVVTADEEARTIWIHRRDAAGELVVDWQAGEILLDVMRGDVRIEVAPLSALATFLARRKSLAC